MPVLYSIKGMRKSIPINSARSLTASFSFTTTNSTLSVSANLYRRRQVRRAKTFVYVLLPSIPVMFLMLYLFLVIVPESPTKNVETTTTAKNKFVSHPTLRRLPPGLIPIRYNVYLPFHSGIDFGTRNFTVDGEVVIHFTCLSASMALLKLHAKEIIIYNDSIIIEEEIGSTFGKIQKEQIDIVNMHGIFESDMIEFKVGRPFLRGANYTIRMKYRAKMLSYMHAGLYVSSYQRENETRYIAATQMQPLDARRLLPCFDEPSFKAEFIIIVKHPVGTSVVSNNQVRTVQVISDQWTVTEFDPTPRMSTYLLALVISDFPYRETKFENVNIRIWAEASKLNDTTHALNIIPMYLEYFQSYFGIPYPLPKLGIRNYVYSKFKMVYNEHLLGERDKQSVTDVLSHELAHMLWLNEGFATLMSFKASCVVENSTSRNRQLFFENSARAMRIDQAIRGTHPLSAKLDSKSAELYMFSRITYSKAAAVLQMVEEAVGEDVFREGLRRFLNRYSYANADRDDLLNSLNEVVEIERREAFSNVNFTLFEFMDSWVYQQGFPLVELEKDPKTFQVYAKQKFFKMETHTTDFDHYRWKIPLFLKNSSGETSNVIWLEENATVSLPNFMILDYDAKGYYRINYDRENWNRIIQLFLSQHHLIPPASRARILDDAFILAKVGEIPFRIALEMSEFLRTEDAYMPFLVFSSKPAYLSFSSIESATIEMHNTMKEFLTFRMCNWGYEPCVLEAKKKFQLLRKSCDGDKRLSDHYCNFIPPELRTSVYTSAIRFGDFDDYMFLEQKYKIEDYHAERDRIYTGLASPMVDTVMDYMRANFRTIYTTMKSFPQILKHVVTFFTHWASSDEELSQIEKFEKDFSAELWSVRLSKYITDQKWHIQNNINFVKKHSDDLIKFFDEYERNKSIRP